MTMLERIIKKRKALELELSAFPEFLKYLGLVELEKDLAREARTAVNIKYREGDLTAKVQEIFEREVRKARSQGRDKIGSAELTYLIRKEIPELSNKPKIGLKNYLGKSFMKRLNVSNKPRQKSYNI